MNKTYSISEIVEASNNILNTPQKNSQTNKNYQNNKLAGLNKPLVLTKEHILPKEETLNNEEVKKEILEEIYIFFKKKVKKKTLEKPILLISLSTFLRFNSPFKSNGILTSLIFFFLKILIFLLSFLL